MRLKADTQANIEALIALLAANKDGVHNINAELRNDLVPQVLVTNLWPAAVPPSMVVRDEPTKRIRANSIMTSFIREPVKGKSFLDLGCGDGYVVAEAKKRGATFALGYDVIPVDNDDVTTEVAKIEANAPYDIIMAYDLLDHVVDETARTDLLTMFRKYLKPGGKIYVRCHPFTSRHGCHNYYKFNKAYAHLFLTSEELDQYEPLPTVRTLTPMITYKQWFVGAGLKIVEEHLSRQNLDDFFAALSEPLLKKLASNPYVRDYKTLNDVLSIQFADFVLHAS